MLLEARSWIRSGKSVAVLWSFPINYLYNSDISRYKSREGNGLLASLTNPTTGHRKLYEPIISLLFAFFPRESWYGCFDL